MFFFLPTIREAFYKGLRKVGTYFCLLYGIFLAQSQEPLKFYRSNTIYGVIVAKTYFTEI